MSAEDCAFWKGMFQQLVVKLNETNDMMYDNAARAAVRIFDRGGCNSTYGSIVA